MFKWNLFMLWSSRKEGADRGLIQAATGIGKTYLAAFDSKNYKHVLFVAHREEILNQAATSFANVRCSNDYGFFNGKIHDTDKAVIFASVASLGKDEYLNGEFFSPDYFDYIVVDEFHHAVNKQYEKIIEYFKTKFLLGLTATPERTDGRSIYEICDYNVPYEINLYQAINRGILGIYDETDYSGLKFVKGDYLESELNVAYLNNEIRDNLIYKHYLKYHSKRALGFCCSRNHAEYMAKVFCILNDLKSISMNLNQFELIPFNDITAINQFKNEQAKSVCIKNKITFPGNTATDSTSEPRNFGYSEKKGGSS